jgi:hypothetical protein
MESLYLVAIIVLFLFCGWLLRKWQETRREKFIRSYMFPDGLLAKLGKQRQNVGRKEQQLVARALRQFFLAHLKSGRKFVSMPSQVVDDLWHEFILYTRHYDEFCKRAFGQFLHHTPAVVLSADKQNNTGLRRVWWHACLEENINPRSPTRLPLLFSLDEKLNIENGFRYKTDCKGLRPDDDKKGDSSTSSAYCGGDFSSSSFDGSTDGFGDSGDGGGDGGDGGGCGGGGCGGGD